MADVLSEWWFWATVAQVVWIASMSVWLLFERRAPGPTVAWILALSFLPFLGVAVYLFVGPRRFERKKRLVIAAREIASRAAESREPDGCEVADQHLAAPFETMLGPAARPRAGEAELYFSGRETFDALETAIAAAAHHVHLEYYIWEPDEIGTRIRDLLAARASAGVEVRLLVDGIGASACSDKFWRPLIDAGGQVERFNDVKLTRFRPWRVNFRTHRKIAVIDGEVGFTGGINITDVESSEFKGDDAWRDTHVKLRGPAVRGLQLVFCEGWGFATGAALEGPRYFPAVDLDDSESGSPVQIVASGPDEGLDPIHKLYLAAITDARERVIITSPYFVPDRALVSALSIASLRGAEVSVVVPRENDLKLIGAASRSYYPELLAVGVKIFEYGPPMLHAKTLAIDDRLAVIGTANVDARSFRLNFEVVAAIHSPAMCAAIAGQLERDLLRSVEVTADVVDGYPFHRRLGQNFARLFSALLKHSANQPPARRPRARRG